MHVFLLNGPPKSGKNTIADHLDVVTSNIYSMSFAAHLKDLACDMLGCGMSHLEQHKDDQVTYPGFSSYRELLIKLSEEFCKPMFGRDYFGHILGHKISHYNKIYGAENFVISDSGFIEELDALRTHIRVPDVQYHIVQLYRPGTTFSGDSRDYITSPHAKMYVVVNDGSPVQLIQQFVGILLDNGITIEYNDNAPV